MTIYRFFCVKLIKLHEIRLPSGNLQAYRNAVLPTARELYGIRSFRQYSLSKHKQNIQEMLELMALKGAMTTWDLARYDNSFSDSIRSRDKMYRRLLSGRFDRGKSSPGVLEVGLVIKDDYTNNLHGKYRLSIYGLLFCFSVFSFSDKEIEKIVQNYLNVLPMIFGKWNLINSYFENPLNLLTGIANGYTFENNYIAKFSEFPLFEINNYINTKYADFYESISERDFSNQLSYWFFTNLPIRYVLLRKDDKTIIKQWIALFESDVELKNWYFSFLEEMKHFSIKRFNYLEKYFQLNSLIDHTDIKD